MPNTCHCARPQVNKVTVIGLKGGQFHALKVRLQEYPIAVREVSPDKFLGLNGLDGLVVLTRFLNHQHSTHAKRIAGRVIRVAHGAATAVAEAIVSDLKDHAD
jgi:hypothetical protein